MEESNFKKLIVWQKAMDLVDEVYSLQRGLPKSEIFGLGDQLRRAVVSIPSNIAEGNGRTSPKELAHFLSIARGSVYEVVTQLIVAKRQGLIPDIVQHLHFHISIICLSRFLRAEKHILYILISLFGNEIIIRKLI